MNPLDQLESLVRAGEFAEVTKVITKFNLRKIPRGDAARFANLANRVDQSRIAIRLLYPIINSEKEKIAPASEQERVEYADALRRTGLVNEARTVLQTIDVQSKPLAHLHIALCYFTEWRYAEAIPHLKKLLTATKPDEYLHTIAKVNLAAAMVHEEMHKEALLLLEDIQTQTAAAKQILLLGNSLELTAQIYIMQGRWNNAAQILKRAENVFSGDHNKYLSWVRQWRAIVASHQSGQVRDEVFALRAQAAARNDWESVRDFDLHIAMINGDSGLLKKVYFGTPQASYRRRLLRMAGGRFSFPQVYEWSEGKNPAQTFDILKACTDDGRARLIEGSLPHQLLTLLAADFYRPLSIGAAFNKLFPNERFGQQGSANRISRVVMKLRRFFADAKLDLTIVQVRGKYRLVPGADCSIRVLPEVPGVSREELSWLKFRGHLAGRAFSRKDLERVSNYSPAKAVRLLRWAVQRGQVRSIGYGPTTKYELTA